MIKRIALSLLLVIVQVCLYSQSKVEFSRLIKLSDSAYRAKNYPLSAKYRDEAILLPTDQKPELGGGDLYNFACIYSLNKETGKALNYLEKAFYVSSQNNEKAESLSGLQTDTDLDNIRRSEMFKVIVKKYLPDELGEFDILLKAIDDAIIKSQIRGVRWEETATYNEGDVVIYNGSTYVSKIENNIGANPDSSKGEWKKKLTNPDLIIENLEINNNEPLELGIALQEKFNDRLDSTGQLNLNGKLIFKDCKIKLLGINKITAELIEFESCETNLIWLNKCNFKTFRSRFGSIEYVGIYESTIGRLYLREHKKAKSENQVKPVIEVAYSTLKSLWIDEPPDDLQLVIRESKIVRDSMDQSPILFYGVEPGSGVKSLGNLELINSTLGNEGDSSVVSIHGFFNMIEIDHCNFNAHIYFYTSNIQERFHVTNNVFNGRFSINNTIIPTDTKIKWSQIAGEKIAKYDEYKQLDSITNTFRVFKNILTSEKAGISNIEHFDDIMRSYQVLYSNYRSAGDLESANGCYSEMKDIQTKRFQYLYSENKSFNTFFRWKLSQLMKFYTNHGTDPAKAIVVSIWVVFAFGIFFFFFPSDWDVTSKGKLIHNYKDFIEKNEKGYIKPFFVLTLGFLLSLINALTLSLNAFTTLGFGNIPTHGLARYFCVLEGFIGWFLLSIFTVALISQVLG